MKDPFFINNRPNRMYEPSENDVFKDFDATELYCPKCGHATPVRKRLLLVLPEGDKYEYLCSLCATSVGSKISRQAEQVRLIV